MTDLPPLPEQPAGVPWPTDAWPEASAPEGADRQKLEALVEYAFADPWPEDLGETHALLVVQRGEIVLERYAAGMTKDTTQPSWSKAKSITQALAGLLVKDGALDISEPAPVPEWREAGDPRAAITLDQLMRMSSGLGFQEEYRPDQPSDVIEMLWGAGKENTAHFAASFPLEQAPGSQWYYSSGTSNIVSRCLADTLGAHGPAFEVFMRQRLFEPIGMRSPVPKFDAAGTFIGSSFCFCTPRDFARFGLLYLRDGVWDGKRLLPEGWVDYARTPTGNQTPQQIAEEGPYGAHWWLEWAAPGCFSMNGYDGQYTVCVPDRDLILVRNGKTSLETKESTRRFVADVIGCFA